MKNFLLATGLLFSVGFTHAVTINFNDTAPPPNSPRHRTTDFGPNGSYTEKGFTFRQLTDQVLRLMIKLITLFVINLLLQLMAPILVLFIALVRLMEYRHRQP